MQTKTIPLLAALLISVTISPGQTVSWTGGGDQTSWNDPNNWGGSVPGSTNDVMIESGAGTTVTISSVVVVRSIQCSKALTVSGGSLTITAGASAIQGAFNMTGATVLAATGAGTTLNCSGPVDIDDENVNVSAGASITLSGLKNYSKVCNGLNWTVTGTNSVLSLPGLTNINAQACTYPVVEVSAGGQLLAANLTNLVAGAASFQADGPGSVIDFSGLTTCSGSGAYTVTLEASGGGTVRIPHVAGGPLLSVIINGGAMPIAQLAQLSTLSLGGLTTNLMSLTNLQNLTVTGGSANFPVLTSVEAGGTILVSSGAVVTLPAIYTYIAGCSAGGWTVTGSNSVLSFAGMTNFSGSAGCSFPMQAQAGGQLLATNLQSITGIGPAIQADGTNSVVDLTGLIACAGQVRVVIMIEASAGGTVRIPHMTGGGPVSLTLNPGGFVPNAFTNLLDLTVNGVSTNFPTLSDLTDGNIVLSGGSQVTLPALRKYTKSCDGAYWTITGSNTVLSLPVLTNITGQACNFPTIEVAAGAQMQAASLASILAGPLAFQADGSNSVINLTGLTSVSGQAGYMVTFEASGGGNVMIPNVTGGPLVAVIINSGGTIPTVQLQNLTGLTVNGAAASFPALTSLGGLTVSSNTVLNLPAVSTFTNGNITVSAGAYVNLPAFTSYNGQCSGGQWIVTGSNSVLNLSGLKTFVSQAGCNSPLFSTQAGGLLLATNLDSILAGPMTIEADGTNSVIGLNLLTSCTGESPNLVNFEASSGGTVQMPGYFGGANVGVTLNPGGTLPLSQFRQLASITANTVSANFPALTNFDSGSFTLTAGATVTLPALASFQAANVGPVWEADGSGTVLNLPALTNFFGSTCCPFIIQASGGGSLELTNLPGVRDGFFQFTALGSGSVIGLTRLSSFSITNGTGQFTEQNGGALLLTAPFVMDNVGVSITPANPLIPPTVISYLNTILYGQAWSSYRVEQETQSNTWALVTLVPLTNSFQVIGPVPAPLIPLRATEFVANPALVTVIPVNTNQVQITLFGVPTNNYAIDTTTNLHTPTIWTSNTFAAMTNSFRFLSPVDDTDRMRFYRARVF